MSLTDLLEALRSSRVADGLLLLLLLFWGGNGAVILGSPSSASIPNEELEVWLKSGRLCKLIQYDKFSVKPQFITSNANKSAESYLKRGETIEVLN